MPPDSLELHKPHLHKASTKLGEQEGLMKKLYDTFKTICWDKTTDFRTAVAVALDGKKTKDGFAKHSWRKPILQIMMKRL
jgi:hypothetical protein